MRAEDPRPVRLADYRPPDYLIHRVHLDVHLAADGARVTARLSVRANPLGTPGAALELDGDELALENIRLDGAEIGANRYTASPQKLVLQDPPAGPFELEIVTKLDPDANTKLMGLYRTSGTWCTQCEAEGFRRITYFLDRPDVLAVYTTRIEAERSAAPILLSNGNLVEAGELTDGRHFAVWHDPFPKPSYLFALVGGDLGVVEDSFRTVSGRDVALKIYVEHGKEGRATYAMDALKRSMAWDERVFGLEYDLDIFMIVAVSDFNMGAMENKGLNVFNDRYVLASGDTATDADYAGIEAVIAHEYFHNWTGNRITCRDWFQLCLKEGLTVFRDQEFSSDERSRAVKRIADVRLLRSHQFSEDAGPLAHPVRPQIYHEINNFYTATVYEKGAEVVRMLKVMLGADAFRRGMDLYFARHDGEAATVEQFVTCFADASGRDLSQFMLWYSQAGTPEVHVASHWSAADGTLTLRFRQDVPPTPGQPIKQPMPMPVSLALLDRQGRELPLVSDQVSNGIFVLDATNAEANFTGLSEKPVPSLLRGFSAPVRLHSDLSGEDLLFLGARDTDPFGRWQALQTYATRYLLAGIEAARAGKPAPRDEGLEQAIGSAFADERLEPAFAALLASLPGESDLAREVGENVDPDAVRTAREALRGRLSNALRPVLQQAYDRLAGTGRYSPDAASAGRRSLRAAALDLLCAGRDRRALALAATQYDQADNMTERMAALSALCTYGGSEREAALDDFHQRFRNNPLVVDKWLVLQATIPEPSTVDRVLGLTRHPSFSMANPNRVRSLFGSFAAMNPTQFNRTDGRGFDLLVDTVLDLDGRNPQVAARLLANFKTWRLLEPARRVRAQQALQRVADTSGLSADVSDIVRRSLEEAK